MSGDHKENFRCMCKPKDVKKFNLLERSTVITKTFILYKQSSFAGHFNTFEANGGRESD